ncbi:hypothetical protein IIA28_21025 [candidate division KSB1 bacterium]|nr:hypothetical protein [candidate division KSB1 bacterium]
MSHTGMHINGAGSFKPTMGEVPPETVATRGWKSITANPDCLKPAYLVQAIRRDLFRKTTFTPNWVRMPPEKKKAARRDGSHFL